MWTKDRVLLLELSVVEDVEKIRVSALILKGHKKLEFNSEIGLISKSGNNIEMP